MSIDVIFYLLALVLYILRIFCFFNEETGRRVKISIAELFVLTITFILPHFTYKANMFGETVVLFFIWAVSIGASIINTGCKQQVVFKLPKILNYKL